MLLPGAFGSANANLVVSEDLRSAVAEAVEKKTRAIKILADQKAEKLSAAGSVPESDSLAADFLAVGKELCEDGQPCLVLLRLKGSEGADGSADGASAADAGESDWALISWAPDDSPVKLRMLTASSKKTVTKEFKDLSFREYNATERDEVTLEEYLKATKKLSGAERRAAMSPEERGIEDVKIAQETERKTLTSNPMKLAGLTSIKIKAQPSFRESLDSLFEEGCTLNRAMVCLLAGKTSEEVDGEILDDIDAPSSLKGLLPVELPAWVVLRPSEDKVLFICWLPDNAPAKLKMKLSTFKGSVQNLIEAKSDDRYDVRSVELSEQDDLADDLATKPFLKEAKKDAPEGAGGGYGGGVGGFALPGMGGKGKGKIGFALPGMGSK